MNEIKLICVERLDPDYYTLDARVTLECQGHTMTRHLKPSCPEIHNVPTLCSDPDFLESVQFVEAEIVYQLLRSASDLGKRVAEAQGQVFKLSKKNFREIERRFLNEMDDLSSGVDLRRFTDKKFEVQPRPLHSKESNMPRKRGLRIYIERLGVYVQWWPLFHQAEMCSGFVIKLTLKCQSYCERHGEYKRVVRYGGVIIRGYAR